jgi:hypothetical protein
VPAGVSADTTPRTQHRGHESCVVPLRHGVTETFRQQHVNVDAVFLRVIHHADSLSLERYVAEHHLSPIRGQNPPLKRATVEHGTTQVLPHRQLVTPTPSRRSILRHRFHGPIPRSTNHHQIVRRVKKFRPSHATVDSVMRDKVILATAMPTMTVTVLDEFEDLLGDCHALIVLADEYRFRAIFRHTGNKPEPAAAMRSDSGSSVGHRRRDKPLFKSSLPTSRALGEGKEYSLLYDSRTRYLTIART